MCEASLIINLLSVNKLSGNNKKKYMKLKGDLGLCKYFWVCLFNAVKGY